MRILKFVGSLCGVKKDSKLQNHVLIYLNDKIIHLDIFRKSVSGRTGTPPLLRSISRGKMPMTPSQGQNRGEYKEQPDAVSGEQNKTILV